MHRKGWSPAKRLLAGLVLAALLGGALPRVAALPSALAQDAPATSAPSPPLTQEDIARTLPATDLGASRGVESAPERTPFQAQFASAPIADNPLAPDAIAVGAPTCIACHALENVHASHSLHAQAFRAGAAGSSAAAACESCHGPGSAHAADPMKPGLILAFTANAATPVGDQTAVCLTCHAGGARQHWLGSIHASRGLSCTDCHNPMARLSPEGVLANRSINATCATCHQDIRARFNLRSHMPLPEGQLSCVDCHNPHGTLTDPLLKTDTVNQTCYSCHAEKRGPFLFEHAPVRRNCLTCHDPHGSSHQTLLVMPLPFLCQQCHTHTRHPNDLQTPLGLANGAAPDERLMGRACITCHTNIHGSNNPSGVRFHK